MTPSALPPREPCPYCGQPLTPKQVAAIRERVCAAVVQTPRAAKAERLLVSVTSQEFKERLRGVLHAVDDLRNLQDEERKRHEAIWGAQEEACSGIERFIGRVQAQVRAIVEGRGELPRDAQSSNSRERSRSVRAPYE